MLLVDVLGESLDNNLPLSLVSPEATGYTEQTHSEVNLAYLGAPHRGEWAATSASRPTPATTTRAAPTATPAATTTVAMVSPVSPR